MIKNDGSPVSFDTSHGDADVKFKDGKGTCTVTIGDVSQSPSENSFFHTDAAVDRV